MNPKERLGPHSCHLYTPSINVLQSCIRQLPLPLEDTDLLFIHNQPSVLVFHSPLVSAMGGVILKHVHLWETEWLLILGVAGVGEQASLRNPCLGEGFILHLRTSQRAPLNPRSYPLPATHHVFRVNEWIIHCHHLNAFLHAGSQHQATDTSKSVQDRGLGLSSESSASRQRRGQERSGQQEAPQGHWVGRLGLGEESNQPLAGSCYLAHDLTSVTDLPASSPIHSLPHS